MQPLTNLNLIFSLFFGKAEFKFWRLCFIRSQCFRVAGVTVSEGKTLGERKCKICLFFYAGWKNLKWKEKNIFLRTGKKSAWLCLWGDVRQSAGVSMATLPVTAKSTMKSRKLSKIMLCMSCLTSCPFVFVIISSTWWSAPACCCVR